MLPAFNESTKLSDMHFAVSYAVATNSLSTSEANTLIKDSLNSIVITAHKEQRLSDVDIHILSFYEHLQRTSTAGGSLLRPLHKMLEERSVLAAKMDVFFKYIETDQKAHAAWIYSNLPRYFIEHPIDGINTHYCKDFSNEGINEPTLMISEQEILNNCFSAGYLKSPIAFRLFTPKGDNKIKQQVMTLFVEYGIGASKPEKIGLKNNMQEWEFTIPLKKIDAAHLANSIEANKKFKELVDQHATGNAYFVYLEDQQLSENGFRIQKDIQAFLDTIKPFIICLDGGEKPTHLYLSGTLHLLSIRNKKGETLPLSKFKFDLSKPDPKKAEA